MLQRNILPRIIKRYSPNGRRNRCRPLKRLMGMWYRNGSKSDPTTRQIDDDDDDDDDDVFHSEVLLIRFTAYILVGRVLQNLTTLYQDRCYNLWYFQKRVTWINYKLERKNGWGGWKCSWCLHFELLGGMCSVMSYQTARFSVKTQQTDCYSHPHNFWNIGNKSRLASQWCNMAVREAGWCR